MLLQAKQWHIIGNINGPDHTFLKIIDTETITQIQIYEKKYLYSFLTSSSSPYLGVYDYFPHTICTRYSSHVVKQTFS